MSQEEATIRALRKLFYDVDVGETGAITRKQLEEIFDHWESQAFFSVFGLDVNQAQGFFELLDLDESGEVDIEEFIGGLMRMRGVAKGADMAMIMFENKRLFEHLKQFMKRLDSHISELTGTEQADHGVIACRSSWGA